MLLQALEKRLKSTLNKTPFINITWKIEKDLSKVLMRIQKKVMTLQLRVFAVKKTGATPLIK